jgi:hypothetical protein
VPALAAGDRPPGLGHAAALMNVDLPFAEPDLLVFLPGDSLQGIADWRLVQENGHRKPRSSAAYSFDVAARFLANTPRDPSQVTYGCGGTVSLRQGGSCCHILR